MSSSIHHPKPYSPAEVAEILQAEVIGPVHDRRCLYHLWTDTRQAMPASESLFFCLRGPHFDAHDFLPQAIQNGLKYAVVERLPSEIPPEVTFFKVSDNLAALQILAAHHRSRLKSTTVIGITGSNGKTMVKEWLYDLLWPDYDVAKSPLSYNSQVGVPLSVWKIEPHHSFAIIEAGISQPGEMEKLERIIRPDVGIFTYLGSAHDAGFTNRRQKLTEKSKLFQQVKNIILGTDQPEVLEFFSNNFSDRHLYRWSFESKDSDFAFQHVKNDIYTLKKSPFKPLSQKECEFAVPFTDELSVKNSFTALSAALLLTNGDRQILRKMAALTPVRMRMEWTHGINDCMILNDSYTADPEALVYALRTLFSLDTSRKKILVLSELDQLKSEQQLEYFDILQRELSVQPSDRYTVYYVGKRPILPIPFSSNAIKIFTTTEELLQDFKHHPPTHTDILLKGARRFGFEKIAQSLSAHVHETRLEINLSAIGRNLSYFRSRLPNSTKVMAMVKAASYGSGSVELARFLTSVGVDYLAVAYADEGIELRNAHIPLPIMVMNAHPHVLPLVIEHDLQPEIYSFEQLEQLKNLSTTSLIKIHLKIDTGMKRLGFEPDHADILISKLQKLPNHIVVESVLSHLAAADEPLHKDFTIKQIEQFHTIAEKIEKAIGYKVIRHIHNTAGSLDYFDDRCQMVRLGIGLYGIAHSPEIERNLQPAVEWYSFVSQVKELKSGDSVGYGRSFVADKPMKSATVAVGYADGIRRSLSNGKGGFYIHGVYCPIIGRVCMDMTMVDVSGLDNIKADDPVEIIGPHQSIQDLARQMGTIPYEVLTSVGHRVRRIYYKE
ncbi:bifunctional UDP-N-acetylmuramoyl-tripeptide:D-alanyl-D-alanine ligase/alanine racemase [Thermaurantimonas aggregans]|uniref:Alanine racemase n=1 Tax=Thermaurantimonas aggregans TaxID=2173829 RepID=A0A401XHP1_9FLAO|nr:bifunctional UDP-N-acetylmuramoyl-tripeptide:D-alanyl-D-alanine ligase/alanine racemase [Thermaurantimonas aggregans]MCX8149820.1 bifunctional UDP-N-acetylmuramoyl-tripeptide:D-alanyl-D-alanine ligase/alanine racemase [Thermaurantimonas aggregans]GCD76522.1 bifunctional UDP-N-acetylmuramoyl-tripeptide:D-alanyl-D-alanine ligase/alanine racemase [Thermaurantimonas aggregans]